MQNETEFVNVVERLNRLEKKNNHLRFINLALITLIIAGGLVGWQTDTQHFKLIETEKLVIKTSDDKEVATLGSAEIDEHHNLGFEMNINDASGSMSIISNKIDIKDHNGYTSSLTGGTFSFNTKERYNSLFLNVDGLDLKNKNNDCSIHISSGMAGVMISGFRPNYTKGVRLGINRDLQPYLDLYDNKGKNVFHAPND